jgi:hypothetical protein
MGGDLDHSDFVDPDFEPGRRHAAASAVTAIGAAPGARPPSRDEINQQVTAAQKALVELKRKQEELEQERAQLEEARRRRIEFEQGREEMLAHLTRGVGLLSEAEQAARREAEQLARTLEGLREALDKVTALREDSWTAENYSTELTRALTTLENARMEWNAAQLKWPILSNSGGARTEPSGLGAQETAARLIEGRSPSEWARLGLALTWPVAAAVLCAGLIIALVLGRN